MYSTFGEVIIAPQVCLQSGERPMEANSNSLRSHEAELSIYIEQLFFKKCYCR